MADDKRPPLTFITSAARGPALAAALTYLSRHEPFRSLPLHTMVGTVSGAIARGDFGFAMRGRRIVGFACYAVSTQAIVEDWIKGGEAPGAIVPDGDVVVMLQAAFDDREATFASLRHMASLHPGKRYVQKRHHRGGMVWGRFPTARRAQD